MVSEISEDIHVICLVVAAVGFFFFWARTRFWLPVYVHVLALISLALSMWMIANVPDGAPISKQGPLAHLLTFALPAMVYFFFIFYGGQRAAHEYRFETFTCPHCQQTLDVKRNQNGGPDDRNPYVRRNCSRCGLEIGSENKKPLPQRIDPG